MKNKAQETDCVHMYTNYHKKPMGNNAQLREQR